MTTHISSSISTELGCDAGWDTLQGLLVGLLWDISLCDISTNRRVSLLVGFSPQPLGLGHLGAVGVCLALVDKKSMSQPNSFNSSSEKCGVCNTNRQSGVPRTVTVQRTVTAVRVNVTIPRLSATLNWHLQGLGVLALPLSKPVTVAPSKSPCDLERHGDRDNLNHDNHPSPSRPAAGRGP